MIKHGEVISGQITCKREQCQNDFTWLYYHKQKGNTDAFIIPKTKSNEALVSNYDELTKQAKVYCPYTNCGQPNYFKLDLQ